MMEAAPILLIVMLGFSGLLVTLFGYHIKQSQSIESISLPNLDMEKVRDKAGFSRFAGNQAMRIGLSALLSAVLIGLLPQFLMTAILLFIFLTAAFSLAFVLGCKRFL